MAQKIASLAINFVPIQESNRQNWKRMNDLTKGFNE